MSKVDGRKIGGGVVSDAIKEQFIKDVADHQMTVRVDNGLYRHISFRAPKDGWNMWFELVTWPGALTIRGDMGTWTFSRVEDMFTFFRDDKLQINADYWAEKLQHGTHGGRDGAKVWSEELFKKQLLELLTGHEFSDDVLRSVTAALREEVLCHDNKIDLMVAARDFSCPLPRREGERGSTFTFDPCELPDGKEYAFHFLWCLYAIVWGIQQYDAAGVEQAHAVQSGEPT